MLDFIDTHSHLTDEKYENVDDIISKFDKNHVKFAFCVGYDLDSSIKSVELSKKYYKVYAIIGVHPEECLNYDNDTEEQLKLLAKNKKVIGIGEIGLDYHFLEGTEEEKNIIKEKQKQVFIKQIILANKLSLPIIIHVRDAFGDLLDILKDNKQFLNNGGVVHCFSQSVESFEEIKKLGLIISFNGIVTFKNAKRTTEVLEKCEFDDFILETDCPYLAPEPYRGIVNEPKYVCWVAEKIAEIKNVTTDFVIEKTNENVYKLFKKFNELENKDDSLI